MNGAAVPYHLRPNKFIDRQIFVETLGRIAAYTDLSKYSYVSMGGKYLEDFKVIHSNFGIVKMFSIEKDRAAAQRQEFNKPFDFIECRKMSSGDLVANFERFQHDLKTENSVTWLDYTSSDRGEQLREFQALVAKLNVGDVVKITINAAMSSFVEPTRNESRGTYKKKLLAATQESLGDYFISKLAKLAKMTSSGISEILFEAIKKAANQGIFQGSGGPKVKPLVLTRYRDGQQMVTASLIVIGRSDAALFTRKSRINKWPLHSRSWVDIKEISVPDLSIKEKLEIDKGLFVGDLEDCHRKLPFRLDKSEGKSLNSYKSYFDHYRRYPTFLRVYV